MLVSPQELVELLTKTWDATVESPYELKDQVLDEVLTAFIEGQKKPWIILSFPEWNALATGRKVFHSLFGEGVVVHKMTRAVDGGKSPSGLPGLVDNFVSFRGFRMELQEAGWPWDQKVQIL